MAARGAISLHGLPQRHADLLGPHVDLVPASAAPGPDHRASPCEDGTGGVRVSRERVRGAVTPAAAWPRLDAGAEAWDEVLAARRTEGGCMGTSVKAVAESFNLLFESLRDPAFCRTQKLNTWGERDLLLLVRAFLLGYHKHIVPEHGVRLPGSATGMGRIDFLVDGVAVEFAVRRPTTGGDRPPARSTPTKRRSS